MAKAMGTTPWLALHDRSLAFNATAMRAYEKARTMRLHLALQQLPAGDFGVNHIRQLLLAIFEEL